jgi:serine/threonine-protein kinase
MAWSREGAEAMSNPESATITPISVGEQVGSYLIDKLLGEGGMGFVALARDPKTLAKVAMKFLKPEAAANAELLERFFREAKAPNVIDHEGVAKTFMMDVYRGLHYLVMEYVDGRTLLDELRSHGPFPVARALRILDAAADALGAAHRAGFTHRDIKLENIMLRWRGDRVVILDFGIAKLSEGGNAMRTRSQAVFGTSYTMSPEQCRGAGAVDHRSDVYSLACVAYAILSGRYPFPVNPPGPGEEIGHGDLTVAHMRDEPPHLTDRAAHVPRELGDFLRQCLAKDPAQRPQSMDEFREGLARFRDVSAEMVYATPSQAGVVAASIHDQMAGIPKVPSGQSSATAGKTPYGNGEMVRASSPPRRARTTKIMAVAVASTLAIATVCIALYRTLGKPETPSASASTVATPAKPVLRTVRVVTNPPGARVVSADGRDFGTSPAMIDGDEGATVDVRITHEGFATKLATIRFDAGDVRIALEPNQGSGDKSIVKTPPPSVGKSSPAAGSKSSRKERKGTTTTTSTDELPSNPLAD